MEAHHPAAENDAMDQHQPWWACCGSVQDLFGNDWICRWMIGLFGRLRIGAFALFWALVLVILPLAFGKLANAGFGFPTSYWLALVLFPVLGAWLGYQWFVSIVDLPRLLTGHGRTPTAPAYQGTRRIMRHPLAYVLAMAATVAIAAGVYPAMHMPLPAKWISILAYGLWWYFILRTLTLALAVFWDCRHWLNGLRSADEADLPDAAALSGLKPLAQQLARFLWFYLLVVGPYLVCFSGFLWRKAAWIFAVAWVLYLALPLYGYGVVVRPAAALAGKGPGGADGARQVVHGLNDAFWQYLKFILFRKAV